MKSSLPDLHLLSPRSALPRPAIALEITAPYRPAGRHIEFLRGHLLDAIALVDDCQLRELSVALVNNAAMAAAHAQFMAIAGPTDVLTFELDHAANGSVLAGEIMICAPVASKQADLRKSPLGHELLLYALHGVLHLCGRDDKTPRAFKAMHREEDIILSSLGIGPVFARTPSVPAKAHRSAPKGAR